MKQYKNITAVTEGGYLIRQHVLECRNCIFI